MAKEGSRGGRASSQPTNKLVCLAISRASKNCKKQEILAGKPKMLLLMSFRNWPKSNNNNNKVIAHSAVSTMCLTSILFALTQREDLTT